MLQSPSLDHLFGTDQFGRDVFSLVLEGIGVSLEIAVIATLIAGGIGTLGGIVAGYVGGATSWAILRATDIVFAIPAILLALAIVTALGPGIFDSALAIGVGYIPIFVRVVRAPVLALREADFVRAGRVLGYSRLRLLFRHILPSVSGAIAVQVSLALAWAILAEASLSFLGLGPPPPTASLGRDGQPVEQPRQHRVVDARGPVARDRARRDRLQLPRRRPARRRRPAIEGQVVACV